MFIKFKNRQENVTSNRYDRSSKHVNKKKETGWFSKIDFNKIWNILFFLILTWIFLLCILCAKSQFNPLFVIGIVNLSIILLCLIYKKVSHKYKHLSNKATWTFYGIITVVMVILQLVIGYLVRTNPSWDLGLVIQSAQEILQYGHSTDMSAYYIQAPNNIFITLLLASSLKLFSWIGVVDVNVITLIVNIIFIQVAILLLFKIAKSIFNNVTACFTLVLMFLFLPIYPYATIMYTDTTSMFLPVAFLYSFIKIAQLENHSKKYIYALIIGVLAFISLQLKVTALIVLIAFVIHEMINHRFVCLLKILGVSLLTFLIIQISYTTILKKTEIMGLPYEETKQVPFTHFIMMGMTGTGAFSGEEWQFTLQLPDYETRKEANIEKIKERLKAYGTQGYINFLNRKIVEQTWGEGTYSFQTLLPSYNVDYNIAHQFLMEDGKYYAPVFYYCLIFHFTMLLSIIISIVYSIRKGKENATLNISKMSMLGLLLFLLIWETRSRYMLNYIPVYILIFTSGIVYFHKDMKDFFNKLFIKEENTEKIDKMQN